ncbi:hypothetical protein [Cognatishimia activa]|uniref:Uncharacterized protein n=1 Tax=Cognatishimia activa TaxID=1715691 RepID=A0A0P1IMZ5_9RHOB|nr:hypothetical protein [Cognatishimia activa]CUI29794.1 hypothetical protein TA5113_00118 [Cognatishimia activa]CUK24886.1 hypothetical protein TA5114_00673 [Cognatishimia activa]
MYMSHMEDLERNRQMKAIQRMLLSVVVFGAMVCVLGVIAWVSLSGVNTDISLLLPPAPTLIQ